jgi:ABC-2 type transport system ATP-binding protein
MKAYAIQARGLAKRYGRVTALHGLDLDIPRGAVHGLLGLNGAGKSTAIRLLSGLLEPSAGHARVAGHDLATGARRVRASVGLIAEQDGTQACASWTAQEYVAYFARLRGLPDAARVARASLAAIGIEGVTQRRLLGTYSTGMRRRVEVARGLLGQPAVLFLDEPSRGLDLPSKRDLWALVRRLASESGVTVLVSSHEVAEIRALCGSLTVLSQGRVTYAGPTARLGQSDATLEENLVRLLERRADAQVSMGPRP